MIPSTVSRDKVWQLLASLARQTDTKDVWLILLHRDGKITVAIALLNILWHVYCENCCLYYHAGTFFHFSFIVFFLYFSTNPEYLASIEVWESLYFFVDLTFFVDRLRIQQWSLKCWLYEDIWFQCAILYSIKFSLIIKQLHCLILIRW